MYAGTLICIDALQIAIEEKTRVNMVMLGAIAKASGFIPLEALEETITESIGEKYPAALSGNLAGLRRGYQEARAPSPVRKDQPGIQGPPGRDRPA